MQVLAPSPVFRHSCRCALFPSTWNPPVQHPNDAMCVCWGVRGIYNIPPMMGRPVISTFCQHSWGSLGHYTGDTLPGDRVSPNERPLCHQVPSDRLQPNDADHRLSDGEKRKTCNDWICLKILIRTEWLGSHDQNRSAVVGSTKHFLRETSTLSQTHLPPNLKLGYLSLFGGARTVFVGFYSEQLCLCSGRGYVSFAFRAPARVS